MLRHKENGMLTAFNVAPVVVPLRVDSELCATG